MTETVAHWLLTVLGIALVPVLGYVTTKMIRKGWLNANRDFEREKKRHECNGRLPPGSEKKGETHGNEN